MRFLHRLGAQRFSEMNWFSRLVRRQVASVMRSGSYRSTASGVPVFVDQRCADTEGLVSVVSKGAALIELYDQLRWNWCRRSLEFVFVTPLGRPTAYFSEADRSCVLAEELARACDPLTLASVVVHEAVHARISRIAAQTSYHRNTTRIERICLNEQLEFLRRAHVAGHAGAERFIDHYSRFLEQPSASAEEELDRETDRIMNLVAADWVKRLAVRRLRKRLAKRRVVDS